MKVVFCTPTREKPHDAWLAAMERMCPALDAKGVEHSAVFEVGSAYISWARANMLHKALATDAEFFVFLDDDLSWWPEDMLKLLETEGDVVSGTYRFRHEEEEYMGDWHRNPDQRPVVRTGDRAIKARMVPAGFLKVSRGCIRGLMRKFPELCFGAPERQAFDLFNHGAHVGGVLDARWWGEDYAFAHRWGQIGSLWLVPDLNIDHHLKDRVWKGNLHRWLCKQPGGSDAPKMNGAGRPKGALVAPTNAQLEMELA
jgi:hypothetical protein